MITIHHHGSSVYPEAHNGETTEDRLYAAGWDDPRHTLPAYRARHLYGYTVYRITLFYVVDTISDDGRKDHIWFQICRVEHDDWIF